MTEAPAIAGASVRYPQMYPQLGRNYTGVIVT